MLFKKVLQISQYKVPTFVSVLAIAGTLCSWTMFLEVGHKVLGIEPTSIPTYAALESVPEETGEITCSWDAPPEGEWVEVKMDQKLFALDPGTAKNDNDPDFYGLYHLGNVNVEDIHVKCTPLSHLPIVPETSGFIDESSRTVYLNFGTPYGGVLHPGTKVLVQVD